MLKVDGLNCREIKRIPKCPPAALEQLAQRLALDRVDHVYEATVTRAIAETPAPAPVGAQVEAPLMTVTICQ